MFISNESTVFNLDEYDVNPFTVDYEIFSWQQNVFNEDFPEIPEDCYYCQTSNYYIKPLPVEVADDILKHIGKVMPGTFSDVFAMVTDRWQEIGLRQEVRDMHRSERKDDDY